MEWERVAIGEVFISELVKRQVALVRFTIGNPDLQSRLLECDAHRLHRSIDQPIASRIACHHAGQPA